MNTVPVIQRDAEGPGPETRPATWSTAKVPLPARSGSDTAMSNQATHPPHLPVHVFTNLGGLHEMTSVKQFASTREAQAWIDLMKPERPDCYCIVDEMELDQSA